MRIGMLTRDKNWQIDAGLRSGSKVSIVWRCRNLIIIIIIIIGVCRMSFIIIKQLASLSWAAKHTGCWLWQSHGVRDVSARDVMVWAEVIRCGTTSWALSVSLSLFLPPPPFFAPFLPFSLPHSFTLSFPISLPTSPCPLRSHLPSHSAPLSFHFALPFPLLYLCPVYIRVYITPTTRCLVMPQNRPSKTTTMLISTPPRTRF